MNLTVVQVILSILGFCWYANDLGNSLQSKNDCSRNFYVAAWTVAIGSKRHDLGEHRSYAAFGGQPLYQQGSTSVLLAAVKYSMNEKSDIADVVSVNKDLDAQTMMDSFLLEEEKLTMSPNNHDDDKLTIVLVAGFERFNRNLYQDAIRKQTKSESLKEGNFELIVFSDSDLRIMKSSLTSEQLLAAAGQR